MRKHLTRWLNHSELQEMAGSYEGAIVEVIEKNVRNRFTRQDEVQPVIVLTDGWRVVPNVGMRRSLMEAFGSETDDWTGRRIRIFLRPMGGRDAGHAGEQRYEKAVESLQPRPGEPQAPEGGELAAAGVR